MLNRKRKLTLDLYDLSGNKICPLYDTESDIPGQAANVVVMTQRNGWKELSFQLPYIVQTDSGEQENYRCTAINADFKIRHEDENGPDWFIISEPQIAHNGFLKTMSVTAGHVSQLLKTKNLGLEFSDDEGNNTGTAGQLLNTILDGTGWTSGNVDTFFEKDGTTEKVRSLSAPTKTGAFNLIAKMCELFDAKPVFHGDEKTVDIKPLNPFSDPKGGLPDIASGKVFELNYGRNIKNVTRTLNSENIATRLYAYGSYGDDVTGYCGIDEVKHRVLTFGNTTLQANHEYRFAADSDGKMLYFTPTQQVNGTNVSWSVLDPASMMYVWDKAHQTAYRTYSESKTGTSTLISSTETEKQNMFSFIMDFDYYDKVGLLTDEMLQTIAAYQTNGPALLEASNAAAEGFANSMTSLTETIGSVDFCRLDVAAFGQSGGYCTITLNKQTHADGVIYRTDYDKKPDKRFKWRVAENVKPNGDPTNTGASVIYVIHNTTPTTWKKVCIKAIDNEKNPSVLTLWATPTEIGGNKNTDRVFLFQTDNVNGYIGAFEAQDEATISSLETATKVVTVNHETIFSKTQPSVPQTYGWWWKYSDSAEGELYFCYKENGDAAWHRVYLTSVSGFPLPTVPTVVNGAYWYNWQQSTLYHGVGGQWVKFEDTEGKRIAKVFGTVWSACLTRDRHYKGLYDKLVVNINSDRAKGNHGMVNGYGSYYVFTTTENMHSGDKLIYDTTEKYVIQRANGVDETLEAKTYRFDNVEYFKPNILDGVTYSAGGLDPTTGGETTETGKNRTNFIRVYPGWQYMFSGWSQSFVICYYNDKNGFVSSVTETQGHYITIPGGCHYMRISAVQIAGRAVQPLGYNSNIIIDDEIYTIYSGISHDGQLKGLIPMMKLFADRADETFLTYRSALESAQNAVKQLETTMGDSLGDILRDGWMQKSDYVDGDEEKLYDDAMESIEKISKPEATYNISYLDLYGTGDTLEHGGDADALWPDVTEDMAAHLIDEELDINEWAFFDTIKKCYDKPWETQIQINTNLTLMNQHTFTDVMKHIADVANELNAKQTKFEKALIPSANGKLGAEILQGQIDANTLLITGGSSTWYTDENGNMIFISADGQSAMTLTGNGFAIANSKNKFGDWNWRSFGTGDGFTADEIMTGVLRAGAVTILGSEQFYWDADNIYIINPQDSNKQIRIGRYDGVNYGIGFTQDGGANWQHAIDFDGTHITFGHISDIEGLQEALDSKTTESYVQTQISAQESGIRADMSEISADVQTLGGTVNRHETTISATAQGLEAITTEYNGLTLGTDNLASISKAVMGANASKHDYTGAAWYYRSGKYFVLSYPEGGYSVFDFTDVPLHGTQAAPVDYVLSFNVWAMQSSAALSGWWDLWVSDTEGYNSGTITAGTGGPVRVEVPFKFTGNSTTQQTKTVHLRFGTNSRWTPATAFIVVSDVMLEQSTKASQWVPSKADTDYRFETNESRITQSANEITALVQKVVEGTDKTGAMWAQIQENAGNINLRVEQSTYNNFINNNFNPLSSKVNDPNTGLEKAWSEINLVPGKISQQVGALQVGGTNLVQMFNSGNGYHNSTIVREAGLIGNHYYKSERTFRLLKPQTNDWSGVVFVDIPMYGTNQKYTLSFYKWSYGTGGLDGWVDLHDGTQRIWGANHFTTVKNGPTKQEYTFTYTQGQKQMQLRFGTNAQAAWTSSDTFICISDIKLEVGNKATDWKQNDNEFVAGSEITMTKDNVEIKTPQFSIDIADNDGYGKSDLKMDKDGTEINRLTVTESFQAPGVAQIIYANHAVYGNKVYNKRINIGQNYDIKSLRQAAEWLSGKTLVGNLEFIVDNDVNGEVYFNGIGGSGDITIYGYGHTQNGQISIVGCTTMITIQNLKIIGSHTDYVIVHNYAGKVKLVNGCVLNGNNVSGTCFFSRDGASNHLDGTTLCNATHGIQAETNSDFVCYNLKGRVQSRFLFTNGANVKWWGTRPCGSWYPQIPSLISCAANYAGVSATDPQTLPETEGGDVPVSRVFTVSINATTGTQRAGSWRSSQNELIQGIVQEQNGNNEYCACMWFDRSSFTGKNITVIEQTLDLRRSGGGSGQTIDIHLWTTPVFGKQGDCRTGSVDKGSVGTLYNDEKKTFTVPVAVATDLINGTVGGLMLRVPAQETVAEGSTRSRNYGRFYSEGDTDVPVLTVTYRLN